MLPSERAERWVRRVGYAALALIALYIIVWLARFVWGNYSKALKQRQGPAEEQFTGHGSGWMAQGEGRSGDADRTARDLCQWLERT